MHDEQPGSDRRRIEALEQVVRTLVAEVQRLRADVAGLRGVEPTSPLASVQIEAPSPSEAPHAGPAPEPAPALPPRRPTTRGVVDGVVSGGLEEAVGRYGTLLVATVAILLGLGAFIQWAVARGLLGPEMRVALGAVAAVTLAVLGLRLRTRGSRTFGNALLAIALAVVHLVAWGAGPVLGLVPSRAALAVAAIASAALAALALREGEEFLFLLGLGGALLAPFVTSEGSGNPGELLLFGGVVRSAALLARRDPAWGIAPRVLAPFGLAYMSAALAGHRAADGDGARFWPSLFALVLAIVALLVAARGVRRVVVRAMLFLVLIGVLFAEGAAAAMPLTGVAYAMMGTLVLHALRRRSAAADDGTDSAYEVVGLPLLFLLAALYGNEAWHEPVGIPIVGAWIAVTTVFLLLDPALQRARHLAVMLTAALLATANLYQDDREGRVPAFALVASMSILAFVRVPGRALQLPLTLALGAASVVGYVLIDVRRGYQLPPFVNEPALLGLTVVAAWLYFSVAAPRAFAVLDEGKKPWQARAPLVAIKAAGPVALFFWGRAELADAWSYDIATFLLIAYYAVVGVGLILLGRRRAVNGLRQTGLALSLVAAAKGFISASDLDSVGLRIGSYLLVGAFFLGVAFLYRAKPAEEPVPE